MAKNFDYGLELTNNSKVGWAVGVDIVCFLYHRGGRHAEPLRHKLKNEAQKKFPD